MTIIRCFYSYNLYFNLIGLVKPTVFPCGSLTFCYVSRVLEQDVQYSCDRCRIKVILNDLVTQSFQYYSLPHHDQQENALQLREFQQISPTKEFCICYCSIEFQKTKQCIYCTAITIQKIKGFYYNAFYKVKVINAAILIIKGQIIV